MSVKISYFKVDNGDMTLLELESGRRIIVDIKIRSAADDPDDETPDVAGQLRDCLEELGRDGSGRLFVDAFLLTHPDKDHCSGLRKHFHLGLPSSWNKAGDKIFIREMWSSPIVFRRAGPDTLLCDDAKAWASEARRRVALFRSQAYLLDGDRIQIFGEDVDGKTDGLDAILVFGGSTFSTICGVTDVSFEGLLIAPLLADDDEEEEVLSKNNSSVIVRLTLAADGVADAARCLFGGDAEVAIWEKVWDKYTEADLAYDVLLAPHHCSWHSLSWDSWSEKGENAQVSKAARSALGQAKPGATIVASSCQVKDDANDPPCVRAKREYKAILKPGAGSFRCVADEPGDEPFELLVSRYGPKPSRKRLAAVAGAAYATGVGAEALGHG